MGAQIMRARIPLRRVRLHIYVHGEMGDTFERRCVMSEAKSKLINCLVETLGRTKTENWWCKRERVLQIATYIRENY